ncbi:MAG: response regulator, partial [Anaerolineales bacterium]|nr:response regulator [Anaerolineales bacterium]
MGKYKILLVDDDPQVLEVVGQVLEDQGYQIIEESSGEAAVETLAEEDFDLVITDLNMYETDGFTVLEKAKAQNPETMVILFTGSDHVTLPTFARSLGFDDYLLKPFGLYELSEKVANCLERLEDNRAMADRQGQG